jgi:hypothetical protein
MTITNNKTTKTPKVKAPCSKTQQNKPLAAKPTHQSNKGKINKQTTQTR